MFLDNPEQHSSFVCIRRAGFAYHVVLLIMLFVSNQDQTGRSTSAIVAQEMDTSCDATHSI